MPPQTLLLVVDSPEDQTTYCRWLKPIEGTFQIVTADGGAAALSYCRQTRPDLVLLDYPLNQGDSLNLLTTFQQWWGAAAMPAVIVLSAQAGETVAAQALQQGAQDALVKAHLTPDLLQQRLMVALERIRLKHDLARQQSQIQNSERKFRGVFESTFQLIALCDPHGQIVDINQAFLQVGPLTPDAVIGQLLWDTPWFVSLPEMRAQLRAAVHQLTQQTFRHETLLMVPGTAGTDPSFRIVDMSLKPLLDENGQVQQILVEAVDITDRRQIEQQLRDRELLLSEAQEIAHLGSWELLPQRQQLTWSREMFWIFGRDASDGEPTPAAALAYVHPEDRDRVEAQIQGLLTGQDSGSGCCEYRVVRPSGEIRWVEGRGKAVNNLFGDVVKLVGTVLDITARKQTEDALRKSEATTRAILQAIPDTLLRLNRDGVRLQVMNADRIQLIGETAAAVGLAIEDILPPALAHNYRAAIDRALNSGEMQTYEQTLPGTTSPIYEELRFVPCGADEVLVIIRDITDRKQAEAALRESERTQRAILAAIPDMLIRTRLDGVRLQVLNGDRVRLMGQPAELVGQPIHKILPPDLADQRQAAVKRALETKTLQAYEQALSFEDEVRYEDIRVVPSGPDEVLVIIRDITDRKQVEAALQRSELRLRTTIANAPVILFALDAAGVFTLAEGRGLARLDLQPEAVVGLSAFRLAQNYPAIAAAIRQALAGHLDYWVSELRGAVFETYITHRQDDQGRPAGIIGVATDITDRYRAQRALQDLNQSLEQRVAERTQQLARSNSLLLAQQEAAIDGILVVDEHRQIAWHNQRFIEIWQIPTKLMVNRDDTVLLTYVRDQLAQPDVFFQQLDALYQDPKAHSHDEIELADGRTLERYSAPAISPEGDYYGRVFFFRDITDRKRTELEILRNRELREAIFNHSTDALFLVDPETQQILDCNQRAVELFEAEAQADLMGLVDNTLQQMPLSDEELAAIAQEIQDKGFWSREVAYQTRKGHPFWGSLAATTISVGGQTFTLVRVSDITLRKQGEEEVRKALAREKELNDLKSRFISMTSHEFRTPLAVIASSAGILKAFEDRLTPEKRRQHLDTIETYIKHTTTLLDDILLINRAEAGRLAFFPETLDIVAFCQNLCQEMQLSATQHQLTCHCVDGAGAAIAHDTARVDPKLLRQILSNLLSNAVKYSPAGSDITVTVQLHAETLMIAVQDAGIGIPTADQAAIFDSFHRGNNVGAIQGTGLGLTVVKRCLDLHQGSIHFQSETGQGTTFTVTLPRFSEPDDAASRHSRRP